MPTLTDVWFRVKNPRYIQRAASIEKTPAPPKKKRVKKTQGEPQTSAESDLREQSMKSLLELIRDEGQPPPTDPFSSANGAGPSISSTSNANKQRAPARRPPVKACAICLSRKYSKVINPTWIATRRLTQSQCDGQIPRCKSCADKDWPCFYMPDSPNEESQIVVHETPALPVDPNLLQQSAMASNLTSANEDLQRELDQVRNTLADAQKETFELRSKLTDTDKQMEQLRTENARLEAVAQVSINLPSSNHDRRNTHQQQTPQPQQTVIIPPPPQPPGFHSHNQYSPPSNQMYHGRPTPSQGKSV